MSGDIGTDLSKSGSIAGEGHASFVGVLLISGDCGALSEELVKLLNDRLIFDSTRVVISVKNSFASFFSDRADERRR